jgi:YjbE family integral membrane protein
VVIALACRSLPPQQQKKAIIFGSVGAIVLRLILTFFAVYLLTQPYLKLIGAALLLWIGVGLLKGEDGEEELEGHSGLAAAIKTIIVADLVMSLDNVIGVAAAAKGNVPLLVIGLVISIPLIIFGSTLILKLMSASRSSSPSAPPCWAGWPARWPDRSGHHHWPAELERLQNETGLEELAPACALLEAAGVQHRAVVRIGRRAETIAGTAHELGCDRIVLGSLQAGLGSQLFGSIQQQVSHLLEGRRGCQVIAA